MAKYITNAGQKVTFLTNIEKLEILNKNMFKQINLLLKQIKVNKSKIKRIDKIADFQQSLEIALKNLK